MTKQTSFNLKTVLGVTFARLRFLAVFLVAALIVGYWDNIKNHVNKWTRPAVAPDSLVSATASQIEYYCPMHPDVIREEPGQCPKCGMPLVKRKKGEAVLLPADVLARVQLTPQRMSLGNIQTSLEPRPLHREIRAAGLLDYDETRLARITARVAGRADELFVTYSGQSIKRGDPLYSLYSPDVYTAQREYLLARKRVNDLPKDAPSDTKMDASAIYNASLQKLALWGITTEQLDKLDQDFDATGQIPTHLIVTSPIDGIVVKKEIAQGQYLQMGDSPYTVADLSRLWLQIKLYEQDVPLVAIGDPAQISVDALPDADLQGAVAFKAFALDLTTRTVDARVVVNNRDLRLRPGMFASAILQVPIDTNPPATAPTTAPIVDDLSKTYWSALQSYLKADQLLTQDKSQGVPELLADVVRKLEPIQHAQSIHAAHGRLANAVSGAQPTLPGLRESWKEISAAMIDIGKTVGIPPDAPTIKIHRCPMKKALWLQVGNDTRNPYYGSEMLTCGSPVEPLPHSAGLATSVASSRPTKAYLSIPRSAVVETGDDRIVYVESSPGTFDMKAVKLGPLAAGDFYPVLEGLNENDRVVTVGTFLVDAENRLNPTQTSMKVSETPVHSH